MRKALKKLRGYTGRVKRDLHRHLGGIPEGTLRDRGVAKIALVLRLLHQTPKGRGKIYALHGPAVDCISKGKARIRYEFGGDNAGRGFLGRRAQFPGQPA